MFQFFKSFREINLKFIQRVFHSAIIGIKRNVLISISSVFFITIILVLLHMSFAIQFLAQESLTQLNKKLDIIVELDEGVDAFEIEPLIKQIKEMRTVDSVIYVDKSDALNTFLKKHKNIKFFIDKYKINNPLPSTLEITTSVIKDQENILDILQSDKYKDIVNQTKVNADIVFDERRTLLTRFNEIIHFFSYSFVLLFLCITTMVIFNATASVIYHRKTEIEIMLLVGATPLFVRAPYILEAIIYACISLFLAFVITFSIHHYLQTILLEFANANETLVAYNLDIFNAQYGRLLIFDSFFLFILSILSSYFAVSVYLHKKGI